ncbi:MAG: hypothetical protein ACRC92_10780 [Peptostreptococcaceae bacterium]
MSIQRVDKFDIQKLATAQTVAEAKANLNKLEENELIIILTEHKLGVKIAGQLYLIPLEVA